MPIDLEGRFESLASWQAGRLAERQNCIGRLKRGHREKGLNWTDGSNSGCPVEALLLIYQTSVLLTPREKSEAED